MSYTLPHFMGYRYGLFAYATKTPGGFADFDFFRINDRIEFTAQGYRDLGNRYAETMLAILRGRTARP